jgi:hypothetical protein
LPIKGRLRGSKSNRPVPARDNKNSKCWGTTPKPARKRRWKPAIDATLETGWDVVGGRKSWLRWWVLWVRFGWGFTRLGGVRVFWERAGFLGHLRVHGDGIRVGCSGIGSAWG